MTKPLSGFHKESRMRDGHRNECKDCRNQLRKDIYYNRREYELQRNKEYKLQNLHTVRKQQREHKKKMYDDGKIVKNKDVVNRAQKKYAKKHHYKRKAISISRKHRIDGFENHHWSYLEEHFCDVIHLTRTAHQRLHCYLIYDEKSKMYRDVDGNLLNTRLKHLKYATRILEVEGLLVGGIYI